MIDLPVMAAIVVTIVIFGLGLLYILSRAPRKQLDRQWYAGQWQAIEAQFKDGTAGQSLAVVSADKLLDRAMQQKGFVGTTMGERLKKHPSAFADINSIWRAHKLRNRIAHEPGQIFEVECKSALQALRQGLKDIGAL